MEWPKENERLFQSDRDWEMNACVNCYRPSVEVVATSYKEGADALARAAGNGDAVLDLAILPIVFLYRQYLELRLKDLIDTARRVESQGHGYPAHHKLDALWQEASQLLKKHYQDKYPPELDNVRPCIDEFMLHDPESFAFRYPTDRRGNPTLRDITHISLRNLYETMDRVGNILDCLSDDLREKLHWIYEMRAEMRADYGE